MNRKNIFRGVEWICFGSLLASAAWMILSQTKQHPKTSQQLATDTIIIIRVDTLIRERPVYVDREIVRTELVPVHDTIRVHDTLYLQLPVEQLEYRDSLYQAWVSGIRPALDSIRIFAPVQTVTITQRTKPPNWGIGITAGYGVTVVDKNVRLTPFIGVGISYNILQW